MNPEIQAAFGILAMVAEDTRQASLAAALSRWAKQRDQLDTKRDRALRARLLKVERALKRRAS